MRVLWFIATLSLVTAAPQRRGTRSDEDDTDTNTESQSTKSRAIVIGRSSPPAPVVVCSPTCPIGSKMCVAFRQGQIPPVAPPPSLYSTVSSAESDGGLNLEEYSTWTVKQKSSCWKKVCEVTVCKPCPPPPPAVPPPPQPVGTPGIVNPPQSPAPRVPQEPLPAQAVPPIPMPSLSPLVSPTTSAPSMPTNPISSDPSSIPGVNLPTPSPTSPILLLNDAVTMDLDRYMATAIMAFLTMMLLL